MLCVALPFRKEQSSSTNDNFGVSCSRTYMRKCRTQLLPTNQLHSRHPFYFQSMYFKKFAGLTLEKEAYESTMKIKYLSLREGFSFPEFLSLCQNDRLLFDEETLTQKNLKMQFDQSSDSISQISSVSAMNQSQISKANNEPKSEYTPQINLRKFETMLKQEHRPLEEIQKETEALIAKAIANQKKRLSTPSIVSHKTTMQTSQEKSAAAAPSYKLPKFSSKGFLACPRELRREIIEFQESNSEKPYPGLILALAYFYGISDRIQRNQSLGFKYLEKITKEYPYFAQAQSIQAGLKSGDHLEAETMEFLLKAIAPNLNTDSELNYLFDDDLPFFFDQQSSTCVPKVFASLDQINQPVEKLAALASRQESKEIKELFRTFARFIQQQSSSGETHSAATHSNLISQTSNTLPLPPPPTHALFEELIKEETQILKKQTIELWMNAANMNHLGAITRLSIYLLENIATVSGQLKEQLVGNLKKGCELLLPACLKIQIQLQIMGDASMQDFEGAYQNMKHLFFLGSDCFKFDLMRLAKHFKDFSFLALYCTYLKNIKDANASICVGLLKEKGYGVKKDLEGALTIYEELKEKKKFDLKTNFDMPLSYRLGKVLHALGRIDEANLQFKAIIQFYNVSKQNSLDIVCLYKIGKLYEKGLGCNQNIDFALRIYQRILSDGSNDEQIIISRQTTSFTSNLSNSLLNDDQLIGSRFLQKAKKTEKIWEKLTKQLDVKERVNYWKQQPISPINCPLLRGILDIDPSEFVGLPKVLEAQSTEQQLPEIADAFEDENSNDEFSLIETTSQLEQIFDEFSEYEKISHNILNQVNYCFSVSANSFSIKQS